MQGYDKKSGIEVLKWAVTVLSEVGMDRQTVRLQARMLLEKAWKKKGIKLITTLDELLDENSWDEYKCLVARRLNHEPLQYILGEQEFMGLNFKVSPEVLIPRWDTEILVNEALKLARHYENPGILDLGTGSGAIAVSLAYYLPQAEVTAVDISQEALEIARENAGKFGVDERIQLIWGDMFSPLDKKKKFHLIISNPPYISDEEYSELPPEVKKEPFCALYGGNDGLKHYKYIGSLAGEYLWKGGYLLLETGWTQGASVSEILQEKKFSEISIVKDWNNRERVVIAKNL